MPAGTMVPGAGACSRAMPSPMIYTSRPALPASSMISRMGRPMREGTPQLTGVGDGDCVSGLSSR